MSFRFSLSSRLTNCGYDSSMAGAIILAIAFGIDVKAENDPHVETAEKGLQTVTAGSTTRAAMYDFFPDMYVALICLARCS